MFSAGLMLSSFKGLDSRREVVMRQIQEAHKQTLILELKRAIEQKDAFMSSVSHELRTPLNGIIGEPLQRVLGGGLGMTLACGWLQPRLHMCGRVSVTAALAEHWQQRHELHAYNAFWLIGGVLLWVLAAGISEGLLANCCGPLSESVRKQLFIVRTSGARLLALINDVMDAATLRQHRLVLKQERLELRQVVGDVVDLTRSLVRGRRCQRSRCCLAVVECAAFNGNGCTELVHPVACTTRMQPETHLNSGLALNAAHSAVAKQSSDLHWAPRYMLVAPSHGFVVCGRLTLTCL